MEQDLKTAFAISSSHFRYKELAGTIMLTCLDRAQELLRERCLKNQITMDALPIGRLVNLNFKFLDDFITNSRRFYSQLLKVVYCEVVWNNQHTSFSLFFILLNTLALSWSFMVSFSNSNLCIFTYSHIQRLQIERETVYRWDIPRMLLCHPGLKDDQNVFSWYL